MWEKNSKLSFLFLSFFGGPKKIKLRMRVKFQNLFLVNCMARPSTNNLIGRFVFPFVICVMMVAKTVDILILLLLAMMARGETGSGRERR